MHKGQEEGQDPKLAELFMNKNPLIVVIRSKPEDSFVHGLKTTQYQNPIPASVTVLLGVRNVYILGALSNWNKRPLANLSGDMGS